MVVLVLLLWAFAGSVSADPIPPYDRDDWPHWIDADADGENTRAEVLEEEKRLGFWWDPYGDEWFRDPGQLDVDHMVPLREAHISGGYKWDREKKKRFANDLSDPDHLIAVSARLNRQKGAKDPAEWRPPNVDYWCDYATAWVRIKQRWELEMDDREMLALEIMLETCGTR